MYVKKEKKAIFAICFSSSFVEKTIVMPISQKLYGAKQNNHGHPHQFLFGIFAEE